MSFKTTKDNKFFASAKSQEEFRDWANKTLIDEIKDRISRSDGIAIIKHKDFNVRQDPNLRSFLRDIKVNYRICNNDFFSKAIKYTDFENLQQYVKENTAVVFFNEPTQIELLLLYCQKAGINHPVEVVSYQKKLLFPNDLEKMLEDKILKIRDKAADVTPGDPKGTTESDAKAFSVILKNYGPSEFDAVILICKQKNIEKSDADALLEKVPCVYEKEVSKKQADLLTESFKKIGAETEIVPLVVLDSKPKSTNSSVYKVEITNLNNHKPSAIKIIRIITGKGLKDSMPIVDRISVKGKGDAIYGVNHDTAMEAVRMFQDSGISARVIETSKPINSSNVHDVMSLQNYQLFLDLITYIDNEKCNPASFELYLTNPGEDIIQCAELIDDLNELALTKSLELAENTDESKVFIKSFNNKDSLLEVKRMFDDIGAETEVQTLHYKQE